MVLPDKYVTLSESFIGLSALILDLLGDQKMVIEKLWGLFKKKYIETKKLQIAPTYQKYIYVLEFMYMAKMINYNEKGEIYNENLES